LQAVRIVKSEVFLDRNAPDPSPAAHQALIRPTLVMIGEVDAAICRSDIQYEGILGHQFVGVVEKADDESWVGQRVVGNVNIADTGSAMARSGLANHDPDRKILGINGRDGCLAEHFVLETRNLVRVPDEIEDDRAIFAQPLASAVHSAQIVHLQGKPYITVLGGGLSGLLCAQVMTSLNASVRLLTTNTDRLELCAKWGVRHRNLDDVGRRLDQDVVIDTTQDPTSLATAMKMVRPRGSIVLQAYPVPTMSIGSAIDLSPMIANELQVFGARCGNIAEGLDAMSGQSVDLSGLITKRFKFEDAINALRAAQEPEQIAVIVDMG